MPDYDPRIDVRPAIAHGRHYDPASRQHEPTTFQEYPKWVHVGEGANRRSFIANNRTEENAILGRKDEPAPPATIDLTQLEQKVEAPKAKRGRPPKAPLPLPQNLD